MPQATDSAILSSVLVVTDASGSLKELNALAARTEAKAIIHTGFFGFFDSESAMHMSEEQLKSVSSISKLINDSELYDLHGEVLRERVGSQLSELSLFLSGVEKFDIPVYTTWGANEDLRVLSKFRDESYTVPNLHIVDEFHAPVIEGTNVRIYGLGGAYLPSSLLNSSEYGIATTDGSDVCIGLWQISELMNLIQAEYTTRELNIFLSSQTKKSHKYQFSYLDLLNILFPMDFIVQNALFGRSFMCDQSTLSNSRAKLSAMREYFQVNYKDWLAVLEKQLPGKTEEHKNMYNALISTARFIADPPEDLYLLETPKYSMRTRVSLLSLDRSYLRLGLGSHEVEVNLISTYAKQYLLGDRKDRDKSDSTSGRRGKKLDSIRSEQTQKSTKQNNTESETAQEDSADAQKNSENENSVSDSAPTASNTESQQIGVQGQSDNVAEPQLNPQPLDDSKNKTSSESSDTFDSSSANEATTSESQENKKSKKSKKTRKSKKRNDALDEGVSYSASAEEGDLEDSKLSKFAESAKTAMFIKGATASKIVVSVPPSNSGRNNSDPNSSAKTAVDRLQKSNMLIRSSNAEKKRLKRDKKREFKKAANLVNTESSEPQPAAPQPRMALLFKNGEHDARTILNFLAEKDQELNPVVSFKTKTKPDKTQYKVAYVSFATEEQALQAYQRVDKDSAGTVILISAP